MSALYIINRLVLIILLFGFLACKTNKDSTSVQENVITQGSLNQAVKDYFNVDDSIEITPNKDGNWLLYVSNKTMSKPEPVNDVKFLVFDKINNKILYKNNFSRSKVKWFDNKQLLLTKKLGIIDNSTGRGFIQYLIDIDTSEMKEYNPDKKPIE